MIDFASMLEVTIDFEQSHLFFPRIILFLLIGMLCLILIVYRDKVFAILQNPREALRFFDEHADKLRLFITIVLVTAYLYGMDFVGGFFPNLGLGFLFCSIVFVFLLSFVFVEELNQRVLMIISCNAVFAPLLVWYVLGSLFQITLP